MRTLFRAAGTTITVSFEPRQEALGMWVPVRMQEVYTFPQGEIRATATYSNFRRFQVFTEERFKPPKVP